MIGGFLADPASSYPTLFPSESVWTSYPFLLPNLVVALLQVSSFTVVLLFLPETNPKLAGRSDLGLRVGEALAGSMGRGTRQERGQYAPLPTEQRPTAQTLERAPDEDDESAHELQAMTTEVQQFDPDTNVKTRLRHNSFTPQVVLQIISVSLLAFHKVSSDAVIPTFLAAPMTPSSSQRSRRDIFETSGGFGYSNKKVGMILLSQAIVGLIAQATIVPYFIDKVGSLKAYRLILGAYPAMYIFTPFLPKLPHTLSLVLVALDL